MSDTAINQRLGGTMTPRHRILSGDKTRRPEAAEHIIEFPGGAIEVARTEDGNYWAHIIIGDGTVIASRLDRGDEAGIVDIPRAETAHQIAVLIQPTGGNWGGRR